ncbi:MAG: GAF sensor-containing diguanylate [Geobacteraceae bacterium]|nr:MAG: GAF sensor-containing diguanylate [Geobacteraceae bacterium]
MCRVDEGPPLCSRLCPSVIDKIVNTAVSSNKPKVFRCPAGLVGFAVPMRSSAGQFHCLIGGGVREKSLDLYRIEALAKTENINPFTLLEQLQNLPITTEKAVEETADRVSGVVASLLSAGADTPPADKLTEKLHAVVAISAGIDKAKTAAETISLLCETIGLLFDIPGIAAALPDDGNEGFSLQGAWGFPIAHERLTTATLHRFVPGNPTGKSVLSGEEINELFPGTDAQSALCFPLAAHGEPVGLVVLFNSDLKAGDDLLVELLTGRAATRLTVLKREEEFTRESALSGRLLTMVNSLTLAEGKEELCHRILEMGTELVYASCGSLMLIDESGETLRIESAIGMNRQLARIMNVRKGNGIAGRVAAGGHPMVVNDIEKDERIAAPNRPRFKTKSFISMPLTFKGETLGVLNLSDKKNQGIFTEADLDILSPLVSHAASMIQRASSHESIELLERLSITDPLTELYNRRFLEKRMEEELSRSLRNGLHLTVMLMDLDNFKTYNDLCGHIAGDKALKKVAKILRGSVRDMDVVTRYGGEEFCILLPGASKKESIFVAERIRRTIENEVFAGEEDLPQGRLTTSIGISSFPEDGSSANALIDASDIALYRAKSEGRNRIVISNSAADPETRGFPSPLVQRKQ